MWKLGLCFPMIIISMMTLCPHWSPPVWHRIPSFTKRAKDLETWDCDSSGVRERHLLLSLQAPLLLCIKLTNDVLLPHSECSTASYCLSCNVKLGVISMMMKNAQKFWNCAHVTTKFLLCSWRASLVLQCSLGPSPPAGAVRMFVDQEISMSPAST